MVRVHLGLPLSFWSSAIHVEWFRCELWKAGLLPNGWNVRKDGRLGPMGYGDVAQLVERLVCNQEVVGSSPIVSTTPHIEAACRDHG